MTEAVMQALGFGGPLAILMGMVILVLWKKLIALEALRIADTAAAQTREDAIRAEAKTREDQKQTDMNALYRELNETLKQFGD